MMMTMICLFVLCLCVVSGAVSQRLPALRAPFFFVFFFVCVCREFVCSGFACRIDMSVFGFSVDVAIMSRTVLCVFCMLRFVVMLPFFLSLQTPITQFVCSVLCCVSLCGESNLW